MTRLPIYRYLDDYMRYVRAPIIFEIGAHIGTDTVELAKYVGASGRLICFEPDPRNLATLANLQPAHGFDLVPKAVGRTTGRVVFWQSMGKKEGVKRTITDLSSTLTPKHVGQKHPWARFRKIEVQSITLDDYCEEAQIDHIDFIWTDIQGGELDLVQGAGRILRNTGLFYFECPEQYEELYDGQPNLAQILRALPVGSEWRMEFRSKTDVLLFNLDESVATTIRAREKWHPR